MGGARGPSRFLCLGAGLALGGRACAWGQGLRSGPLACRAAWEATEEMVYFRWGCEGLAPVCRRLGKGGIVCDRAGEEVGVGVRCRSFSPSPAAEGGGSFSVWTPYHVVGLGSESSQGT